MLLTRNKHIKMDAYFQANYLNAPLTRSMKQIRGVNLVAAVFRVGEQQVLTYNQDLLYKEDLIIK